MSLHERDEFLSVAAHELQTPLTSLLASAQLLLRRIEIGRPRHASELTERLRLV